MTCTLNLVFTGPANQVPYKPDFVSGHQSLRNDYFTFTRKENYLAEDSPFDFGYEPDRSLITNGPGGMLVSFTVPAQKNLRRPSITASHWGIVMANWEASFWPEDLPYDTVPTSALTMRQDPDANPLTIPGYLPMMQHPLEPILGSEHLRGYLGMERLRRLADGMSIIKGSAQEELYLETLDRDIADSPHGTQLAKERDIYLFLRDGAIRAAEDNGLLLFLMY